MARGDAQRLRDTDGWSSGSGGLQHGWLSCPAAAAGAAQRAAGAGSAYQGARINCPSLGHDRADVAQFLVGCAQGH